MRLSIDLRELSSLILTLRYGSYQLVVGLRYRSRPVMSRCMAFKGLKSPLCVSASAGALQLRVQYIISEVGQVRLR